MVDDDNDNVDGFCWGCQKNREPFRTGIGFYSLVHASCASGRTRGAYVCFCRKVKTPVAVVFFALYLVRIYHRIELNIEHPFFDLWTVVDVFLDCKGQKTPSILF